MRCGSSPAAGRRSSSMRPTPHCCGPAAPTSRSTSTGEATICAIPRARPSRSRWRSGHLRRDRTHHAGPRRRDDLPRRRRHRHRSRDPGSPRRAVAYVVDGQNDVFVGDAVQMHGAANGFPGYDDPDAYRTSLISLRDEIRPRSCSSGMPIATPMACRTASNSTASRRVRRCEESTRHREPHPHARAAVPGRGPRGVRLAVLALRAASPRNSATTGDPTLEPSPFFMTMHGYRTQHRRPWLRFEPRSNARRPDHRRSARTCGSRCVTASSSPPTPTRASTTSHARRSSR